VSAAIIERLRETFETVLLCADAASVLFAALGRWGSRIPVDQGELASFVHGPLKDALESRLQQVPLGRLMSALDDVLATAGAPTADHEIPIEVEASPVWRDEVSTKAMRAIEGPVPVLVVAATASLALRLRMALGESTIDVEARSDRPGIERALASEPALVVVDARDPSSLVVERLADMLVHATQTTTVVWGSDAPYGRRLIDAADARGVQLAGVATTEGVGAIFDLVISRRG
jgi:hypothetical protein